MKNRENIAALVALVAILVLVTLDHVGTGTVDSAQRAVDGIKLTSAQIAEVERATGQVSRLITGDTDRVISRLSDLFELAMQVKVVHAQSPRDPSATGDGGDGAAPQSSYQTDFDTLFERWAPAYQQAIYDLTRFEARFDSAVSLTEAYLIEQSALTANIRSDPELRTAQERSDRAERDAIHRWVDNGEALLREMAKHQD